MTEDQMVVIRKALDNDDIELVNSIVGPLLEINPNDVDALFLRSTYTMGDETEEEFALRTVAMMTRACDLGYAPAQYQMAVWLHAGEIMAADLNRSGHFAKLASDAKYPPGMFEHGRNVFHGTHGNIKDERAGISLIEKAAMMGDSDAALWMLTVVYDA
jgi:hypothetical protein